MGKRPSRHPRGEFEYRSNIVASIGSTDQPTPLRIWALHHRLVPVFDHCLDSTLQLLGTAGGDLLDVLRLYTLSAFTALAVLVHHVCSRCEKNDVRLFRHAQARSEKTRAESRGTCDAWTTQWCSLNP